MLLVAARNVSIWRFSKVFRTLTGGSGTPSSRMRQGSIRVMIARRTIAVQSHLQTKIRAHRAESDKTHSSTEITWFGDATT